MFRYLISSIFTTISLFAFPEYSVSGKGLENCQDSLYRAKLHNNNQRYYCSLYGVKLDHTLYGIDLKSVEKYNVKTNQFTKSGDFIFYSDKQFEKDKKYFANLNKKYYYPMGKKSYEQFCNNKKFDFELYFEITDLISDIKQVCTTENKKYIESMAKYVWMKNSSKTLDDVVELQVSKDEKCPVCGMFVYKYPKWVAQVFYNNTHLSFDGVKDLMKFYFNPHYWNEKYKDIKIDKIMVSDYYSNKAIDGKKAYYVIGSDIYGPMGKELIPFENQDDAKEFLYDHQGEEIIRFDEIDNSIMKRID